MSLLSQASLVVVPSGYKEDVVYSVKPTDGSGDLTFTRASDGTRVNSQGLVERVPWNLFQQSETFDNGYWNKGAASITANVTTAPNGTTTADKFNEIATFDTHQIYTTFVGNTGVATLFIYAKKAERSAIQITSDQATDPDAIFNLDTGVVYSSANCTPFIESVGSGWYKCGVTYTIDQTTTYPVFRVVDSSFNTVYAGTAGYGIYIWGAQLVEGSTAKPYFPTTDRQNVPRLDYSNGCPSLLLEPQRTNLVTYSEQFDNAAWSKDANNGIIANNTTSPDGTQNADTLQCTSSSNQLNIYQVLTLSSGTAYVYSIWLKKKSTNNVEIYSYSTNSPTGFVARISVDFDNGTITQITGSGATIQAFTNGWFRVNLPYTSTSTSISHGIYYPTNGTNDVYAWGAQLEAGSYPTSYIPTTSASVTRVADAAYKTGISSLIGQTEGTLFGEAYFQPGQENLPMWARNSAGGVYGDSLLIYTSSAGTPAAQCAVGGVNQVNIVGSSTLSQGWHKYAFAYKANDFVLYVDGVQIGTDSSGSVPTCDEIYIDQYIDGGTRNTAKRQAVLFKTRLTNAELAALTT